MLRNYVSVDVLALLNHVLAREVRGRVGAWVRVSPNPNPNPHPNPNPDPHPNPNPNPNLNLT